MPNLAAAAAVWRAWLDWVAPWVMIVSAPLAAASAIRNSSLRVLLPPVARPVQSSRLIQRFGPPRSADRFGIGSSGVFMGKRDKCMADQRTGCAREGSGSRRRAYRTQRAARWEVGSNSGRDNAPAPT